MSSEEIEGFTHIVDELLAMGCGKYVWRVHDKDTKAWYMEFSDWEKPEAEQWWREQREKYPDRYANCELARVLYRTISDDLMCSAANMLKFFFGQLQMHSPQMDGQHSYRFKSGGWPMTHCKGPNAESAVRAAIKEIQRSREEMKANE